MSRKMFLGSWFPATCTECGLKIGVPWWSMVLIIPFVGPMLLFNYLGFSDLYVACAWIAGAMLMFYLWTLLPLVKR